MSSSPSFGLFAPTPKSIHKPMFEDVRIVFQEEKGFLQVCQFCKNEPIIGIVMHEESQYHVGLNCLRKRLWEWKTKIVMKGTCRKCINVQKCTIRYTDSFLDYEHWCAGYLPSPNLPKI